MTRRRSRSDVRLLASATEELRRSPGVLGRGRAEALRSSTFVAPHGGTCPRCGTPIRIGQRIRRQDGFPGPVHVGCRTRRNVATPTPKPVADKAIPLCAVCRLEHNGECF